MATIPSFESLLLEIRQSLGLERHQSRTQQKFLTLEQPLANHLEMLESNFRDIFNALEMDLLAQRDVLGNLMNAEAFQNAVSQKIWTREATDTQVTWAWCAFNYAPVVGRLLANWNLDGAFDIGMPTGQFWFLPNTPQSSEGKVSQPLKHVIDWLLDLLGLPMDEAKYLLEREAVGAPDVDSIERNLYNWRSGSTFHSKTIEKYFPDDLQLEFKGAFQPPDGSIEDVLAAALSFLNNKGALTQDSIAEQLVGRCARLLPSIANGRANAEEKSFFVSAVVARYSPTTPRVIRQRLRVARAVQDGYRRLLKHLCPGVDPADADARRNKVLQLIAMVKGVFNLTIAAHQHGTDQASENQWFESQLAPWDRATIFCGIAPSRPEAAPSRLACVLNHLFAQMCPDDPLMDWMLTDHAGNMSVIKAKLELIDAIVEEQDHEDKLLARMRASSPWRAVSSQTSFWLIRGLAYRDDLSPRAVEAVVKRLHEVAMSPNEQAEAISIELWRLEQMSAKQRPKDIERRISVLLDSYQQMQGVTMWEAEIAYSKARHLISRNEFDAATDCLKGALDLSLHRNSGQLRGAIAWHLFGLLVANRRLVPGEHEKPYRHILDCRLIENLGSLEDMAVKASEDFWCQMYVPYPDYPQVRPMSQVQAEKHLKGTIGLIFRGDFAGLNEWLRRNAKDFRKERLREVRGNSVLFCWLKLLYNCEDIKPELTRTLPADLTDELEKVTQHLSNWHHAICLLIEQWPEQCSLPDFKRQTPLMLAADHGDSQVVKKLLEAGADVNAQDYQGRTVLHASVTGGCTTCLDLILARHPDITLVTNDKGASAAHTAVQLGQVKALAALLTFAPTLANQNNHFGMTPQHLLDALLPQVNSVRETLIRSGRRVGDEREYMACVPLLQDVEC